MHLKFQDHPINHIVTLHKDIQAYYNANVIRFWSTSFNGFSHLGFNNVSIFNCFLIPPHAHHCKERTLG